MNYETVNHLLILINPLIIIIQAFLYSNALNRQTKLVDKVFQDYLILFREYAKFKEKTTSEKQE